MNLQPKIYNTKSNKGFTLIELLVVISIIGILASVILVSLNTAREKSRDVRRVADVRQLALALEIYYDDNIQYPDTLAPLTPVYTSVLPQDPLDNSSYLYNSTACSPANQRYVLGANLEGDNNPLLDNDVDGTLCTVSCDDIAGSPVYCFSP